MNFCLFSRQGSYGSVMIKSEAHAREHLEGSEAFRDQENSCWS